MADNIFDKRDAENTPAGYARLRFEIQKFGIDIKYSRESFMCKMITISGMQNVSIDNINNMNQTRLDIFDEYIEASYPYIEHKTKDKKESKETYQDLMDEYYKYFGQT